MLKLESVVLDVVREVAGLAAVIAVQDRDLARQLRRASQSVALNVAEGGATRDGRRRARYSDALGSNRETLAALRVAEAVGYLPGIDAEVADRIDRISATLYKLVH